MGAIRDILTEGHPWRTFRRKLYANGILPHPERDVYLQYITGKIANIGCGTMYLPGATNVDNRQLETYTEKIVRADIICDACAIPIPEETYDTVLCSHVLEHQPDLWKFLEEMHRILKRGGRLIIIVPNLQYMGERAYFRDPTHILGCTPRTMRFISRRWSDVFKVVQFNELGKKWKFSIDLVLEKL